MKFLFKVVFSFFLLFFVSDFVFAQNTSNDAIAVRVVANPEHYSAKLWYVKQGFKGSPQSLLVDGYRAIRDGRTVYVNVANVAGSTLYTNIYLISFNQNAENITQDIFSKILSHWKFNTNLTTLGRCRQDNSKFCLLDSDCSSEDVCSSARARVLRDTRRLEDLADLNVFLEDFNKANGFYPKLNAGTYLQNKSFSVWPSWQETLAKNMKVNLPVDPVNKFGVCGGAMFNSVTCWDENSKRVSFSFDLNQLPELPNNSLVYYYGTNNDGTLASFCSAFESSYNISNFSSICSLSVCLDFDGDGYGSPASPRCLHSAFDCDDTNPVIHSAGVNENCGDGIDNDCDGLVDCNDSDCVGSPGCLSSPVCNYDCVCDVAGGETAVSCPDDCANSCGNGVCDEPEECGSDSCCPNECSCGDGIRQCGEECDGEANCDSDCHLVVYNCTDNDGDYYIAENTNVSFCGNICGVSGNSLCVGNNDCDDNNPSVYPGATELCNGFDDNCANGIDEGFNEENCSYLCLYNYDASRVGDLRCCGDDAYEAGPYENVELSCSDGRDNDCDGFCDNSDNICYSGSQADYDCVGCVYVTNCINGDGCCPVGCSYAVDNDCAPTCSPDGCNGNCPSGCTSTDDPDCSGTGCNGDGVCNAGECAISSSDCSFSDCCLNGVCDNGETNATCPADCPPASTSCVFPTSLPCVLN